jgi:hypothetical protein
MDEASSPGKPSRHTYSLNPRLRLVIVSGATKHLVVFGDAWDRHSRVQNQFLRSIRVPRTLYRTSIYTTRIHHSWMYP